MVKKPMGTKTAHKIGIISDTHGLLRPEVTKALQGCEFILHGGDINSQKILDKLQETAPTYAVRGNNDGEWAHFLPETLSIELCGVRFFIVHDKKMLPKNIGTGINIVIYGHSHKYEEKHLDGRLFLNPGSCGPRRFAQPVTLAVLEVGEDGSYCVEKIDVASPASGESGTRSTPGEEGETGKENPMGKEDSSGKGKCKDMRKMITQVMRDTDRGVPVEKIAAKNQIESSLAEQICRLYLTHPGVSVEGIMEKMGI